MLERARSVGSDPTGAPGQVATGGREGVALAALVPLLVLLLTGAVRSDWRSAATVDERTYLEMTLGVAASGLPRFGNGPVERFGYLQARWNLARDGALWGTLAPAYPYLAAPLLERGGVGLLVRANLALLALLAVGTFLLGRRLTGEPLAGTAAAYLTLAGTPVWSTALGVSPYTLAILCVVWAAWLALGARGGSGRRAAAAGLAAGALAGLGSAFHLLIFPMAVALVAALAWVAPRAGALAAAGAAPALTALAALNRLRFGSWNPVSDGPCAWRGCPPGDPQSLGAMAAFAAPLALWLLIAGGVTILAWRVAARGAAPGGRRTARPFVAPSLVVAVAAALALGLPALRAPLVRSGSMLWALLLDLGPVPLEVDYVLPAHGPGQLLDGWAVKALLQGSPFLVLALLSRARPPDPSLEPCPDRPAGRLPGADAESLGWRRLPSDPERLLVAAPVAGLLGALVLRANLEWDFALGHPFLHLRYLLPATPLLAVLAVAAVRRLPWDLWHLAAALASGALLRMALEGAADAALWRRLVLLRGSLLVAAAALAAVLAARRRAGRWRPVACWTFAGAVGLAAGVTLGVDYPASVAFRDRANGQVAAVAAATPGRLALIGYPVPLDAVLTLRAERDVEYADLGELEDWVEAGGVVRWWLDQERPVYALLPVPETPGPPESPWADLVFEPVEGPAYELADGAAGLLAVRRREAAGAAPLANGLANGGANEGADGETAGGAAGGAAGEAPAAGPEGPS